MGAYADLQHGRVWYEEQGSGPPLVLIHGGAVDLRFFDKNIGPLGEHLRVIAVDLWGHGRSFLLNDPVATVAPVRRAPAPA